MKHKMKVSVYLLSSLALAGCASGHLKSESRRQTSEVPKIERLFISLNVENRNFNQTLAAGVERALKSSLVDCGVASHFMRRDPLDLKPADSLKKAISAFRPDAILFITRTGGQVLVGQGGNQYSVDLMLRLRGVTPNIEYWTAKSEAQILTANMFIDDGKSGEKLGAKFLELMRADVVICRK